MKSWVGFWAALLGCAFAACDRGESVPPRGSVREGAWARPRTPQAVERGPLTPEQEKAFEHLESLGYVGGVVNARGPLAPVTVHDPERAQPGLNFYTSGHAPVAILTDMDGGVLHTWEYLPEEIEPKRRFWRRAHLYPNGDVLAIVESKHGGIFKVDRDSRLLWERRNGAHHDLQVTEDGSIYVLTREQQIVEQVDPSRPIMVEHIVRLRDDGEEIERHSLLEAIQKSPYRDELLQYRSQGDILHTNTLELLDGRLADRISAFRAGNFLISMREVDVLAVIDPRVNELVWLLRGSWRNQHQPTVLENLNLLLFDNNRLGKRSRVLELDPVSGETLWEYPGDVDDPMFSATSGSCAELLNGNFLITESNNGRVIEVTYEREIVWEFHNPMRTGDDNELIAVVFELLRLPEDYAGAWLER